MLVAVVKEICSGAVVYAIVAFYHDAHRVIYYKPQLCIGGYPIDAVGFDGYIPIAYMIVLIA
jgi:hypothetical protein